MNSLNSSIKRQRHQTFFLKTTHTNGPLKDKAKTAKTETHLQTKMILYQQYYQKKFNGESINREKEGFLRTSHEEWQY